MKDLDAQLKNSNTKSAELEYNNLQKAMELSMIDTKTKMSQATTPAESSKLMELYRKKQGLYVELHNLAKELPTNQKVVHAKLDEFSALAY